MQSAQQQVRDLLSARSVEQLKADYREACRQGESEARRLVTIELLRRLPRGEVVAFEEALA